MICAVSGAVAGVFLNTNVNNVSSYEDKNEFYSKKGFDLIVKGPSASQIEDFKVRDDVSKCTPYLEIELTAKTKTSTFQPTLLVFDDFGDLKNTENTETRLIKKKEVASNPIAIDYKFAQNNHFDLNDMITLYVDGSPKDCFVAKIFKTDYIYTKGIVITTFDVVPTTLRSGVYLSSNNVASLKGDLKTYKPLGTLLEKTEYQTDEQYEEYLDAFYKRDYSTTHVLDYKDEEESNREVALPRANSSNIGALVASIIFGILAFLTSFVGFIIFAKNNKDYIYKYIHDNGSKNLIKGYSIYNAILLSTCLSVVILATAIAVIMCPSYYSFGSALLTNIWAVVLPVIGIVIGYIISLIKIKKA